MSEKKRTYGTNLYRFCEPGADFEKFDAMFEWLDTLLQRDADAGNAEYMRDLDELLCFQAPYYHGFGFLGRGTDAPFDARIHYNYYPTFLGVAILAKAWQAGLGAADARILPELRLALDFCVEVECEQDEHALPILARGSTADLGALPEFAAYADWCKRLAAA